MRERLIAAIAVSLACALIAMGCGGGSDGTSTSAKVGETGSLSKAGFIGSADAVCAKGEKEVESEYAAYLKKNNITEASESKESKAKVEARKVEVIETIGIPAYKRQAEEIAALPPPSGDEAKVKAFIDAIGEGIKKAEEDPQAVFDGTGKPFEKADELAREYGLKVCGSR